MDSQIIVECDGSFRQVGNAAFVAFDEHGTIASQSELLAGDGITDYITELAAIIRALECLLERNLNERPVLLRTDNDAVADKLSKASNRAVAKARSLYTRLDQLKAQFPRLRFAWQPRVFNWRADALSRVIGVQPEIITEARN